MEWCFRKRAREEGERDAAAPAAAPSSSSRSSSSSSSSAPPPFRGPAADSVLGERLIDVIGIVAAMGFACEVSHCLYLCGETYRKGDKGATNDMIARSLERQCGASAARAAAREDGTTQLIRAVIQGDVPRALQLVQLGAPLELRDEQGPALHYASHFGCERIVRALLDGKYEGRGADVNALDNGRWSPLMRACDSGSPCIVRLLLARGARQEPRSAYGKAALHYAIDADSAGVVALLCAAPGAATAFELQDRGGRTPLTYAVFFGRAACQDVLRAYCAPL